MRVLAFLYPGAEVWNHFQPLARLLRQAGHEVSIADFSHHTPSDEDLPLEPAAPRIALSDQWEGGMGRMDGATYLRLHGADVDFSATSLYYHTLEGFALKRKWLFLDSPFYQRLYGLAHRIEQALDTVRPDLAIVTHGINPLPATAVAKCRNRGLPVLLFESPFFPGRLSLDADGVHFLPGINRLDRLWPQVQSRPLTESQEGELDKFIRDWRNSNSSKYAQVNDESELECLDRFVSAARAAGQPIVFLPEQIPWDASVFLGLDRYESWDGFVRDVLRSLPPETKIIYKRHPKRGDLDANIRASEQLLAVRNVSIHAIFAAVDAVYTFSSNAGFEALLYGLPVICGGLPHYGNRGFTSRDLGMPQLGEDQRALLRRYAYHVIFEYLVEQNDVPALEMRIQEALEERGQLAPAAAPFARAFPGFVRSFPRAIEEYNRRRTANGTHTEMAAGLEEFVDAQLRERIQAQPPDVDEDGLASDRQYVDRVEDADPGMAACYRLAAALLPDGGVVADIGCGCGFGCGILADESRATILGIDASKDAIDAAWVKWHRQGRVEYRKMPAGEFLRTDPRRLQAVTCFGVSEYLPDDAALAGAFWERLEPLGLLLATFVNATLNRLEHEGHVRFRTRAQVEELLRSLPGVKYSTVVGVLPSGVFVGGNSAPRYLGIALKGETSWVPALFEVRLNRALKEVSERQTREA